MFDEVLVLFSELSMPCDQYELQLKNGVVTPGGDLNSAVAELDPGASTVLALQHGHTNVVLDHKSILPALTFTHTRSNECQKSRIFSLLIKTAANQHVNLE